MVVQRGFFNLDQWYAALSAVCDPPGRLIGFEIFRPALDEALQRSDSRGGGHVAGIEDQSPGTFVPMRPLPQCPSPLLQFRVNLGYSTGVC